MFLLGRFSKRNERLNHAIANMEVQTSSEYSKTDVGIPMNNHPNVQRKRSKRSLELLELEKKRSESPLQHAFILSKIFRFLDFNMLSVCRKVSKLWYLTLFEYSSVRQLDLTNETSLDTWMEGKVISLRLVKHLTINNCSISEVQLLNGLKHDLGYMLSFVNLSGCYFIYDDTISKFITHCPQIQYIILDRCDGIYGDFINEDFGTLKCLKELSLRRCFSLKPFNVENLPTSLQTLRFSRLNFLDSTFLNTLSIHLSELKALESSYCEFHETSQVFIQPPAFKLESVNVSGSRICITILNHSFAFCNLKRLILRDCANLPYFLSSMLKVVERFGCNLEVLDLSFSSMYEQLSTELSDCLKYCLKLRVFSLLGWKIDHQLAYYLSRSIICPTLEILSIGTVDDPRTFCTLFQCPSLHYLYMDQVNISEADANMCKRQIAISKRKINLLKGDKCFLQNEDHILVDPLERFSADSIRVEIRNFPIVLAPIPAKAKKCIIM